MEKTTQYSVNKKFQSLINTADSLWQGIKLETLLHGDIFIESLVYFPKDDNHNCISIEIVKFYTKDPKANYLVELLNKTKDLKIIDETKYIEIIKQNHKKEIEEIVSTLKNFLIDCEFYYRKEILFNGSYYFCHKNLNEWMRNYFFSFENRLDQK